MKIRQKTKKLQNLKNPPHLGREQSDMQFFWKNGGRKKIKKLKRKTAHKSLLYPNL